MSVDEVGISTLQSSEAMTFHPAVTFSWLEPFW